MLSVFKQSLVLIILASMAACSGQDKKDASDFFLKANHALNQKNYAEALRLYDEAIAKNGDFSDAYLNKGITLLKLERHTDAYEILTQAIETDPTLVQANLVRAEASLSLGRFKEASEDLSHIEKQYLDSTYFHLLRGNLLEAQSNPSLALSEFDRAILLDKSNTEAYVNRGAVYYSLQNYESARADFEKALTLDPSQPQALNNLGLIYQQGENWDKAIACFDKVLNTNPADPFALNNKGYALIRTGSLEQAKELIEKSLDKLPNNGYALRNLGICYRQKGQLDLALQSFSKAIDLGDRVDMLYGLTGEVYFEQKNLPQACKIWKQGLLLKDSISTAAVAKYCR
jgi:tetratricopeptide (TPR) repeat protein